MVQTMDEINETNAGPGATFQAKVVQPVALGNTVLPAGAIAYLKVDLKREPSGRGYSDIYSISIKEVVSNGKVIAVSSNTVRQQRFNVPPTQPGFIGARTLLNFDCTQP
jgi:hypothetical protein